MGRTASRSNQHTAPEGTDLPASPRPDVVAIYCPLWHNYDHASSWKGEGWCEWELLKNAKPRFPGHYQPYRPSWGLFDESDPRWSAKEISTAASLMQGRFMQRNFAGVEGTSAYKAIAAGDTHTCGIRTDDRVVCWGNNDSGQAPVGPTAASFQSISAGYRHTCGVRSDGK